MKYLLLLAMLGGCSPDVRSFVRERNVVSKFDIIIDNCYKSVHNRKSFKVLSVKMGFIRIKNIDINHMVYSKYGPYFFELSNGELVGFKRIGCPENYWEDEEVKK